MEHCTFPVQIVSNPVPMLVFLDSDTDGPGFYTFTRSHPGTRHFSDLVFRFHEGDDVRFPVNLETYVPRP